MAVKKKKAVKKPVKRKSLGSTLKRTSKKLVDQALAKISPQLQDKIDQLIKTLESSKRGPFNDLSLMAGKILIRAQDISRSLHAPKKKGKKKK